MKITRLLAIILLLIASASHAQQKVYIYGVFENYFPYSPFESTFSDFFKKLNADPQLINKSLHKRTDSSLFSFYGVYENYDRGVLRNTNVEIKLNEISVPLSDSVNKPDTFMQYQVIYNFNNSNSSSRYVKKIFTDFGKEYRAQFSAIKDYEIKDNGNPIGITRNYFMFFSPVSPMTAAWANLSNAESIFTVMVRLKLVENELIIYIPPEK